MTRTDAPPLVLPALPRLRVRTRALHILVAAGVALLSVAEQTPAAVQTFVGVVPTVSTFSFDGGAELDLAVVPITMGVRAQRASIRASFPYLDVSARIPPYRIGGPLLGITIPGQELDEQGPGDVVVTPSVLLVRGSLDTPSLWGSVRVKLPTADETKYLGTGEMDYGPGLGLLAPFNTRLAAIGAVRYDFRGDPPDREIKNSIMATAGTLIRVGFLDGLTVFVSHSDMGVEGADPSHAAGLSWFHPFSNGTALNLTGLTGFGAEARSYGLALGFTYNDGPFDWGN